MECLTFDDMSTLDLIAGMNVNPGCTPIKSAHLTYELSAKEVFEIKPDLCLLKSTLAQTSFNSPPSILRRGRYKRKRRTAYGDKRQEFLHELERELFDADCSVDQFSTTKSFPSHPLQTTPIRLPYENLPFSPSQFMNSLCQSSNSDMTSTPGTSQSSCYYASTNCSEPLTPSHHMTRQSSSPHTPTPFKNAMAEVERRAQSKLWTPGDLDDLGKVLKECDTVYEVDHTGYEADQSSGFTPRSQTQHFKRRLSRDPTNQPHRKVQKKSAKKIVFTDSPQKETSNSVMLDPSYEQVACGLTKDQLDMTQLAKNYL